MSNLEKYINDDFDLEEIGILTSEKLGKERIYLNKRLFEVVRAGGS